MMSDVLDYWTTSTGTGGGVGVQMLVQMNFNHRSCHKIE